MNPLHQPQARASIKFLDGPLTGLTFQITRPITTIGRDKSNDICIADQKISRFHARLINNNGVWSIEKNSQTSSVTVDERNIEQSVIAHNSRIGLGEDSVFQFLLSPTNTQLEETLLQSRQSLAQDMPVTSLTSSTSSPASLEVGKGTEPLPSRDQIGSAQYMTVELSELPSSSTSNTSGETVLLGTELDTSLSTGSIEQPPRPHGTEIAALSAMGIPSLTIINNTTGTHKEYALVKQSISIGRDATNDFVINDPCVSALHLQLVRQGNQWLLLHPHPDRKRTLNGLFFQGRKIQGDEVFRRPMTHGDVFRIGNEYDTLFTITYHDGSSTNQQALPPIHPIRLSQNEITIGRLPDNTLVLPHPQVSGYHARMVRENGTYRIHDLDSTNHLYVNSQPVTNSLLKMGDDIRIGPYRLMYESTQLLQYDESKDIRIDALNLKKVGNNAITLLNDISLSIPPRSFVALVGGSGAGKSMLMDALNGLRPAGEGTVLYNGQDYYRNLAAFSSQIGYVPQDDIVHRDLTVERALYYAAKMRLPRDFTVEQIQQRISEVLEDVEMTDRRHLLIKKLSGGQRKRVSIALELLANPSLFFLDEPTSGLDPGLDLKMMFLLRKLADKGHTILLVTHATNNINVCDYVCFLAPGGRLAYFGPPEEAKVHFGKREFAQIYNSLEPTEENPSLLQEAEEKFKHSPDFEEYVAKPLKDVRPQAESTTISSRPAIKENIRPKSGNSWKQFLLLSTRHIELLKNDMGNLLILLLEAPLIAILLMVLARAELGADIFNANKIVQCTPQIFTTAGPLALPGVAPQVHVVNCVSVVQFLNHDPSGIAYAQQRGGTNQALQDFIITGQSGDAQRVIFLISFIAALFGCINGAREIVKEAAIYRRERLVNLGILPYMFSKMIVLGTLALLQAASMVLIVHLFEPFHQGVFLPVLLEVYITLALTAVAGVILGLAVSAIATNEDIANTLLPVILIPQVIFAGSIIPLKDWISTIVAVIFPIRWAMAALGSTVGLHSDKISGDKLFGNDFTYHGTLYSIYSQSDATQRILLSWLALALTIVVLTLLIGIFLKRKDIRR